MLENTKMTICFCTQLSIIFTSKRFKVLILLENSYRVLFFISFITPGFVGSTGGYSHLHRRCKCVLYYLFCVLLCLSQIPTCRSCSYVFNIVLFSILWSLVFCLLSWLLVLVSCLLSIVPIADSNLSELRLRI